MRSSRSLRPLRSSIALRPLWSDRSLESNLSGCSGCARSPGIPLWSLYPWHPLTANGPCRSGSACRAYKTDAYRTLWTDRPGIALRSLRTLRTLGSLRANGALRSLNTLIASETLRTLRADRALRTLRPLGSNGSL